MYSYLKWIENNYPTSEQKYFDTLQNLIKFFVNEDKYKQDSRYVNKWLTYVKFI